jgi:hypothetical protein
MDGLRGGLRSLQIRLRRDTLNATKLCGRYIVAQHLWRCRGDPLGGHAGACMCLGRLWNVTYDTGNHVTEAGLR